MTISHKNTLNICFLIKVEHDSNTNINECNGNHKSWQHLLLCNIDVTKKFKSENIYQEFSKTASWMVFFLEKPMPPPPAEAQPQGWM